jgi:nitrite reductase/ring-hydroxylating ferredoxin subunit
VTDALTIPRWPRAWYVVARSAEVRPGAVVGGAVADRPFVLFRTQDGRLAALDAHCPHMGTHLGHGRVEGDRLVCPLHHWTLGRDGVCRDGGAGEKPAYRARSWPVAERFGLVFLHPGDDPPPLPAPEAPQDFAWTTGTPVELDTDWRAMMVNGFDLLHLRAVHHRELVEPAELRPEDGTLRLAYTSRVRGGGWPDRLMRWIARDRIRVRQRCHGPVIVVESDLGRTRTAAVLGLLPRGPGGAGVRAFGAFGALRGGWGGPLLPLRRLLSRFLFLAFLKKDFAVVEGMRLRVEGVEDPGVQAISAYLGSLPPLSASQSEPGAGEPW